jgi:hypothetical protein
MANQPSMAPTRKLATMLVGVPALMALIDPFVREVWPQVAPAVLTGESATAFVAALLATVVSGVMAYFVPDAPNVPS